MSTDHSACTGSAAFEAQSSRSLRDFIRTESGSAGMLVRAALIALVWANSPWSQSYVDLWHTELSIRFGDGGLTRVAYEDTEPYRLTKGFLDDPNVFLRHLLDGD